MHRTMCGTSRYGLTMMVLLGAMACGSADRIAGIDPGTAGAPLADRGPRDPAVVTADRLTGGGTLGGEGDFATFAFEVRSGRGTFEWEQHCRDGVTASPTCAYGPFTFHATSLTSFSAESSDPVHCGTWTGTGVARLRDPDMAARYDGTYQYQVERACDLGEPGRAKDRLSLSISSYHRDGALAGGDIQIHTDHLPTGAGQGDHQDDHPRTASGGY